KHGVNRAGAYPHDGLPRLSAGKPPNSPPERGAGPPPVHPTDSPHASSVVHPAPDVGFDAEVGVPVLQPEVQPNPVLVRIKARIIHFLKQDGGSGKPGFPRSSHAAYHPPATLFVTDES